MRGYLGEHRGAQSSYTKASSPDMDDSLPTATEMEPHSPSLPQHVYSSISQDSKVTGKQDRIVYEKLGAATRISGEDPMTLSTLSSDTRVSRQQAQW